MEGIQSGSERIMNPNDPPSDKFTILAVDDVPTNLDLLHRLLDRAGYRVLATTTGAEALRIIPQAHPDLVLLDVAMAGMDGFETCKRIKALPGQQELPIIFVTARTETEAMVRGFDSGGVDYITKPIEEREVIARVHTHLKLGYLKRFLRQKNEELERTAQGLRDAVARVKTLSGLIPVCSECGKLRNDKGYWENLESFIKTHTQARLSVGLICPDCWARKWPGTKPGPAAARTQ
jgi:phosphoserine phosphatase RsbU/P